MRSTRFWAWDQRSTVCDAKTGCTGSSATDLRPEDLFSYIAPGKFAPLALDCANPTPIYLSYSGAVDLTGLNRTCNGADPGDWANAGYYQVQDASGGHGDPIVPYGPNKIAAMSAIGYSVNPAYLNVPEPTSFSMLGAGAFSLWLARRRLSPLNR